MIRKRLQFIYSNDETQTVGGIFFNSYKDIHKHLFEHGLYREFQITDSNGCSVLYYRRTRSNNRLEFTDDIPGSLLFEIVNKHASAKL